MIIRVLSWLFGPGCRRPCCFYFWRVTEKSEAATNFCGSAVLATQTSFPETPPPCLNGDSGWNLLVAVMWCSTRSWQKQSTPSLCSVTAGVDTEKPCSLTGAERTPLPLESLHTWKLNLIFAGWSSWALALVQKSLGSQGVTAFITFLYMKGIVFKDNEYLFLFPLLEHRRHGVCPTRRPCGLPSVSYRKLWAVAAGWRW